MIDRAAAEHRSMMKHFFSLSLSLLLGCSGRVVLPDEGAPDHSQSNSTDCAEGDAYCHPLASIPIRDLGWVNTFMFAQRDASIAVDDKNLYVCLRQGPWVSDAPSGGLLTMPKAGGAMRWLSKSECTLVGDGSHVYWMGEGNDLWGIFTTDGDAPRLVTPGAMLMVAPMAAGGDRLFWLENSGDGIPAIMSVPKAGGTATTVLHSASAPAGVSETTDWAIAADDRFVFWLALDGVMRANFDGTDVRQIYRAPGEKLRALAVRRDSVLIAKDSGGLWSLPKDGGDPELVAAANFARWEGLVRLHTIPSSIFFVDSGSTDTSLKVVRECTTTKFCVGTRDAGWDLIPDFASDETTLYELKIAPGGPLRIVSRHN